MRAMAMFLLLGAGCSTSDPDKDDTTCELSASLTGAASWSSDRAPACLSPFAGSTGMEIVFVPLVGTVQRFTLDIREVTEGQTGTFPGSVTVTLDDDTAWSTPRTCAISITEHAFVRQAEPGRVFQLAGTGTCGDPAASTGAAGMLTIQPFSFRFQAHWP